MDILRRQAHARAVMAYEPASPGMAEELRSVLDTLPCLVWTSSPDGQVDFVNRRWCEYTGVSFAESCMRWSEAIHGEDMPTLLEEWGRALASGESGTVEARLRRFDGQYRRFLINASPLRDNAGGIVKWYGVNSDIEEQTRAECALRADIEERKRAEALLADENCLLEMIARGCSLPVILDALCQLVDSSAGGCHCSVRLVDATSKFRHGAAPSLPPSYNEFLDGQPVQRDSGPCAMAAFLKTQVIASDLASDSRWSASEWRNMALALGLRSCWSTPILSGDQKVLGTFAIYHREPGIPTAHQQNLIQQLTQIASIAIERVRGEAALKKSEAFLAKALVNRPLISVVDDDESVRESLPDLLTEFGFSVQAFSSAEAFLASDYMHQTRCLILDIAMPGMTGADLQLALKHRRQDLPIVFITAHRDDGVRSRVIEQGAVECLFKPFSDTALLEAVNIALNRH